MINNNQFVFILYNSEDVGDYVGGLKCALGDFGVRYWPSVRSDSEEYIRDFQREVTANIEDVDRGLRLCDFLIVLHSSKLLYRRGTNIISTTKREQMNLLIQREDAPPVIICRMDDTPLEEYSEYYDELNVQAVIDLRTGVEGRNEENVELAKEWVPLMLLRNSKYGKEKVNEVKKYYRDREQGRQVISEREGGQPFIFVSYKHDDREESSFEKEPPAMAIVRGLNMQNYRLWYDRGLSCGEDWLVPIEEKIDACSVFLALMTEEYFSSPACVDEFTRAYHKGKKILPVILPEENKNKLMKLISGEKDRKAGANIVGYLIATKRMNCYSDEDGDILSRLAELEEVRECLRTMEEIEERDRERLLMNEE